MIKKSHLKRTGLIIGVLCSIVGLIYLNSFSNGFIAWDDDNGIVNNVHIRSLGWENVTRIFTPGKTGPYQPLRTLSHAIDYHFWELDPFGYHLTNLLFYILTCVMVFLSTKSVLKFVRNDDDEDSNSRIALFSALLFAVHPVHVEAVTWLSARKEVLLGFFFFLSLYLYLRAKDSSTLKHQIIFYCLAFIGFLAAVLSKPTAVVLPLVLLLFEFCTMRGKRFPLSLRKIPLYLPFILMSLYLGMLFIDLMRGMGGIKAYRGGDFFSNLLLVPYLYILYTKLMTFTVNYAATYTLYLPYPVWGLKTGLSILANIAIWGCAVYTFKKARTVFFAISWFYITLLPVSNIIPISTMLADRYAFLASYGLCLLLGLLFERLYRLRHPSLTPQFFKVLSVSVLSLLVAGYSYMTIQQNRIWKNTYTLWADAAAKYPDNHIALSGLAVVYIDGKMYEEARKLLEQALSYAPYEPKVLNNLGIAYFRLGRKEEALHAYRMALAVDPYVRPAHMNLASLYIAAEDYSAAERVYKHFLEEYPKDAQFHYYLGELYRTVGRLAEAKVQYERSLELAPRVINPSVALGELYLDHFKDREKALFYFKKALEVADGTEAGEEIKKRIDSLSRPSVSAYQGAGEKGGRMHDTGLDYGYHGAGRKLPEFLLP